MEMYEWRLHLELNDLEEDLDLLEEVIEEMCPCQADDDWVIETT